MQSPLVDYHCHLDLFPDCERVYAECGEKNVTTLAVTTTPLAWEKNREWASHQPSVRVALGLHPQLISERPNEHRLFERLLSQARFVGEIGLDGGPVHYRSLDQQIAVFERILQACADQGNKILSIHSVRAAKKVLHLLEKFLPQDRGTTVLHWFGGTRSELEWAIKIGCYFSINSEMLDNCDRAKLVLLLPLTRILTETDGPFRMEAGRPARPSDVASTVTKLAKVLKMDESSVRQMIAKNVERLEQQQVF
jgi:TatD DNase family protein